MKLSRAYVCFSCKEVTEGAPHGKCPACDSDSVYPLGWVEYTEEERRQWLDLIRGKRLPLTATSPEWSCFKTLL
jgi:hypothetical protein